MEKILIDTETKLSTISANTINKEEKAAHKKLKELRETLVTRQEAIIKKAFTLYQQMSGPELRGEWNEIVTETCFTVVPPATQQ